MHESAKGPGPGTYDQVSSLSQRSSSVAGLTKTDLERQMETARAVPGPGAYAHHSSLRSRGSPRLPPHNKERVGGLSLIEQVQRDARTRPGPGAYHVTPTFQQELAQQKFMRSVMRGERDGESARTPRAQQAH